MTGSGAVTLGGEQRTYVAGERVKVVAIVRKGVVCVDIVERLKGKFGTVIEHAAFPIGEFTIAVALDGDDGVRAFRADELERV